MNKHSQQKGFTIIELLIATSVFSVVLLIASTASIQIGRLYYKGLVSARTQEVARNVMDSVGQDLQFSDSKSFKQDYTDSGLAQINWATQSPSEPVSHAFAVCIGSSRYTYWLGQQVQGGNHGLVVDTAPASGCAPAASGTELLGDNMRLTQFSVVRPATNTGTYNLSIKVAYGDSDLLTTYNEDGSRVTGSELKDTLCRSGIAGNSFCATSMLDTTVKRRLE